MTGGEGRWKAVEGGAALRQPTIIVSAKGAARWQAGHPWIYRTDVYDEPGDTPGIVAVTDRRGRHLGQALYSPRSEIRLRLLTRGRESIDAAHAGPGPALDLFTYHGSFALHLARRAARVSAVDSSAEALARGANNAALNGLTNITWREANAFDLLRELDRRDERFDTIVLDPPAFAKTKDSLVRALAGYKEINL